MRSQISKRMTVGQALKQDINERKREAFERRSKIHPVFHLPGWIVDKLEYQGVPLFASKHKEVIKVLPNETLCILFTDGVELQLSPTKRGLHSLWLYHTPTDTQPVDAYTMKGPVGAADAATQENHRSDTLTPWDELSWKKDYTAHEYVALMASLDTMPDSPEDLDKFYVVARPHQHLYLTLSEYDLHLGFGVSKSYLLSYNRDSRNRAFHTVLHWDQVNEAAKRLSRETRGRFYVSRAYYKYRNLVALSRYALNLLGERFGRDTQNTDSQHLESRS